MRTSDVCFGSFGKRLGNRCGKVELYFPHQMVAENLGKTFFPQGKTFPQGKNPMTHRLKPFSTYPRALLLLLHFIDL